MELNLNDHQIRVLGCLIEKELTTPEYYPLTLSALTNACNQKSNREPVMSLTESEVLDALKALEAKYLVREKQLPGSRVAKYAHKLTGTLTDQFGFKNTDIAVLSILFLRGPQTPGEIRTRTQRSCDFKDIQAVEQVLANLEDKNGTSYVKALSRQPGKREIRYCHLFGSSDISNYDQPTSTHEANTNNNTNTKTEDEINELRLEVSQLRNELDDLKAQVAQLIN
ncbi:MAG: YceH family protein [Gammaproteobacteria bacterium]|nr:YceH family protein [Gammaproteobacteria bacterium]